MALADIIRKIETDADSEAQALISAAEERATAVMATARQRAEEERDALLARSGAEAEREASRLVAAAKLSSRDEALRQRRMLLDEVLNQTVEALAAMPDAEYATFLAANIIAVARGGESLRLGAADANRAAALTEALRLLAPGLNLQLVTEPAPFDRGALVEGERVRADLSLASLVEERRDQLELTLASVLFSEGA